MDTYFYGTSEEDLRDEGLVPVLAKRFDHVLELTLNNRDSMNCVTEKMIEML